MILTYRCSACRREASFLASDLLMVLGGLHETHVPPWPCSRCKTKEYIDVIRSVPSAAELQAGIRVRRPTKQVTRWLWTTVVL